MVPSGLSLFPFVLSQLAHQHFRPEVLGVPPSLSYESLFELLLSFIDIFQKLAAVKDQREWVTASGAHKVSGPGRS